MRVCPCHIGTHGTKVYVQNLKLTQKRIFHIMHRRRESSQNANFLSDPNSERLELAKIYEALLLAFGFLKKLVCRAYRIWCFLDQIQSQIHW